MPSALSAIRYLLSTGNWQLGTGNQPLATRRSMGVASCHFRVVWWSVPRRFHVGSMSVYVTFSRTHLNN